MRRFLMVLSACMYVVSGELLAQSMTGELRGVVRDTAGRAASGVEVVATGPFIMGERRARTGTEGVFRLLGLPPGPVTVRVQSIGFRPVMVEGLHVVLGTVVRVPDVEFGQDVRELGAVRIQASRMTLDPDRATIGATLSAEEIGGLPSDRDFTSILSILPHANRSENGDAVNVSGSTGLENAYFVDGVNITDPVRMASATQLPYNFIRTLEVKNGGYEAEYGRALGALVNAVTYSGSNEFETSFFGFLTSEALLADPRARPSLVSRNGIAFDAGARFGGPIVRDRIWYSAAYNPRVASTERLIGPFGAFADRRVAHVFAAKLSLAVTPSTNVEVALLGDPTEHQAVEQVPWADPTYALTSPDPYLLTRRSGGRALSATVNTVLGGTVIEASLSRAWSRFSEQGDDGSAFPFLYVDDVEGTVEGRWQDGVDDKIARTTARVRATRIQGRHTGTLGFESDESTVGSNTSTYYIERDSLAYWWGVETRFPGEFHNRTLTVFAQDRWRVMDRLTLNLGVRWSSQTLTGARGTIAQRFADEWQPRAGFVWFPTSGTRGRVLGSYGRFYQQSALWVSPFFYGDLSERYTFFSTDPRAPGATPDSAFGGVLPFDPSFLRVSNPSLEHLDEFTLGYERLIRTGMRAMVRVVRRELRSSFQMGNNYLLPYPENWFVGTPGEGKFDFLPPPRREYTALELSAEGVWRAMRWRGSYVRSRTFGNYPGLFDADVGVATPGRNQTFMAPNQAVNSTGLLPNDRTHVLKWSAFAPLPSGFSVGVVTSWSSGTPVSELSACPCPFQFPSFVVPRGSAGRTPSVWRADLRLARELAWGNRKRGRMLLDVMNLGDPQTVVRQYELSSGPNADAYRSPLAYQSPMMMRIGFEFGPR